ncbi:hypothetical protein acsn021_11410 [Anaerocolumna cellulosilytica]|uniref:Uncharacterized protein n=1 Tax=Anaerocolumna cellulosilytica TaxID=433286 RepID=A0A6S6R241_9FIRM|nr:hypothetical protein [Anaerocolumna cellulosilytica]MBB5194627.1 hypothetical protein [Anaerocolumna cellulosilytica]BCJ93572.1 hypothetical protein acsn021_11410 [Anaerocolumna cellulosilytica]
MLFYLTTNSNIDKLDCLEDAYILNKETKCDLNQETFLKYIKKDIRNLQVDYLIIDMSIFEQEDMDIKGCLESYLLLNPKSKVILLPALIEDTGELFGAIDPFAGVYVVKDIVNPEIEVLNILNNLEQLPIEVDIPATEPEKLDAEYEDVPEEDIATPDNIFLKAASPIKVSEGQPLKNEVNEKDNHKEKKEDITASPEIMKLEDYIKTKKNPASRKWNCENIMIGFIGTERRMGTTTAAFMLANLLHFNGAKVTYAEVNKHNHLDILAEQYEFVPVEEHYVKKAITYFRDSKCIIPGTNFIVLDLGSISENDEKIMNLKDTMDKLILVSGSRPYDLKSLNKALELILDKNLHLAFNMARNKDMKALEKNYAAEADTISYLPYCSDILSCDKVIWENIEKIYKDY